MVVPGQSFSLKSVDHLETPCVLVDERRLKANILRFQQLADQHGCKLRPHVKTHKSVDIWRLQAAAGADGITTSKSEEAAVFLDSGAMSATMAYPVVAREKPLRVIAAARQRGAELRFIVDNETSFSLLSQIAHQSRYPLGVYIKVDVGLGRVGVDPLSERAITVARHVSTDTNLDFLGLISHAGHAYASCKVEDISDIAEKERDTLLRLRERLEQIDIEVKEVSVGSTPTVAQARTFEGITEIRPGNYVFFDLTAIRLGIASIDDVALFVLATVVALGRSGVIVDAGSKVLSSDLGPHGTVGDGSFGRAFVEGEAAGQGHRVTRLSEEHGFIEPWKGAKLGGKVLIVPNHSCVVTNLAERFIFMKPGGEATPSPVNARGMVR